MSPILALCSVEPLAMTGARALFTTGAPPVSAAPVPNSMMCTPWQGQPPWHRVGRLAASTGTNISTAGNALLLQPLPAGELRLPRTWLGALEPPGVVGLFAREAAWRRAAGALSSGRLVVAVLGSSVTAGCGASEPWDVWRNGSTRKLKLVQTRCAIEKSWGRRFHDELQAVVLLGVVRPYGSSCSHHNVVAHDLLLLLLLLLLLPLPLLPPPPPPPPPALSPTTTAADADADVDAEDAWRRK